MKLKKYSDIFESDFFPGKKKDMPQYFKVVDDGRELTYSFVNSKIFTALGYDREVKDYKIDSHGKDKYTPTEGDIGTIKGEYTNPITKRTWCWFVSENGKNCVINKSALRPYDKETVDGKKAEAERAKAAEEARNQSIINRHIEYISDVFIRIEDLGKYNVEIKLSIISQIEKTLDTYSIFIRNKSYRPGHANLVIFDDMQDYFEFNKVMEIVMKQLLCDYDVSVFRVNTNNESDEAENRSYQLTIKTKNLELK